MKKVLLFVVLSALLTVSTIFAQDTGVQLISGPEIPADKVSMDDLKIGKDVEIDGWGILKPTSFEFIDNFSCTYSIGNEDAYGPSNYEADFAFLRMDITNTDLTEKNYLEEPTITCIFDDDYVYGGFCRQYNFNKSETNVLAITTYSDFLPIKPMYQGHYAFGCTLPNAVVNSKKPLRMEITLGDVEMTYNIRK